MLKGVINPIPPIAGASEGDVLTIQGGQIVWDAITGGSGVWGAITGTITDQTDLTTYIESFGYITDLSGFTTSDLAEGTNLYFTDSRAITALTGQDISLFNNDVGYITSSALGPYVLKAGDTMTGALAIDPTSGTPTLDLRPSVDDSSVDFELMRWGQTGFSMYWDVNNLGGVVFDNAFLDGTGIPVWAGSFYAITDISAPSASFTDLNTTNLGVTTGSFTTLITNSNGTITARNTNARQLTLGAYNTTFSSITPFFTLTSGAAPTGDLGSGVTIGGAYVYRVGGTDVSVSDGGTGASSFTSGALLLGNGTSAIKTDATLLFWDDTNNRLGIGTNTPLAQLHVTNTARIGDLGFVGSYPTICFNAYLSGANFVYIQSESAFCFTQNQSSLDTFELQYSPDGTTGNTVTFSPGFVMYKDGSMLMAQNSRTFSNNALLTIDTVSTTYARAVLELDQADTDQPMLYLTGNITTGTGTSISTSALGTYYGKVQVTVNGVGRKWIPLYND